MKKIRYLIGALAFFMLTAVQVLSAQEEITYTGQVVAGDSEEPLIGVNLLILRTGSGTQTDFDGHFELSARPGDSIRISYIGYDPIEYQLGVDTQLSFTMYSGNQLLEEIIVVGYGTQKQKDLTSAISTVDAEEIMKTPTGQAMQSLQGKVAGMQIVSSGAPGSAPKVRVRGIGSYPGSDNEAPLYVVDGMFFDNIDFLNTSDIATISVLKDASAAAIYGVRAANGVVLIETKSGRLEQPAQITYNGYYGIQQANNILKMANSEQFVQIISELDPNRFPDYQFVQNAMQRFGRSRINPNIPDVNTDWYSEIMRPAPIQNHSINVTGGGSKATYALGANYFGQDGILDMKNEYQRFNLRSKVDYQALDWLKLGGNMIMSNGTKYSPENTAWFRAYFAVPILPVLDDQIQGAFPDPYSSAQYLGYRGGQNPFQAMEYNDNKEKIRKLLANFYVEVDLIPDKLSFKTTYNHNFSSLDLRNVNMPFFSSPGFQNPDAGISRTWSNFSNQIWDNILTFDDQYGLHGLTVMGGTSYRDEAYSQLRASARDFPTDQEEAWYIDQAETIVVDAVGDGGSHQYGISYFGRLSYNFDHKYLLYGTFRADGSSKYQEKWGYFPTVGAGWVLSQEDFFNIPGIDYFKFRGSWGKLGNDNIQASDGARTTQVVNTVFDGQMVPGTQTSNVFSSLRWEVVEELNFGLTSNLFDSRLTLDADYYTRDTKNAAIRVEIPLIGGSVLRNVGIIRNSGFEMALDWSDQITDNWSYSIGGNFATLKNEVIDLFGQPYIDGGTAEFRQRSIVGQPVLAFFGREVIGVYQNEAEINADPVAQENNLEPGDLKFRDQNNDGVIDDADRVILGSYFPDLMYGFNVGLNFLNFNLTANFLGQSGNSILNRKRGEYIFTNDTNLDADLAINRWHGEGTSNKYPSANGLRKGWNQALSDYYIEDGSYFRIQNVTLGYTIPGANILDGNFPETTITLTADRPLTIFDYNGFNPEVENGIDRQTYPIPSVYTVGLNVRF